MSNRVTVGIFWAIDEGCGQHAIEFGKQYCADAADPNGFINYPYSHFDMWEDVNGFGKDCYKYPRGRVLFDVNENIHKIFADICVCDGVIDEIVQLYGIREYRLCRDEHYVCEHCRKPIRKENSKLEYRILRGKDKIGANLIELSYGKTKLLLELGKELDGGASLSELEQTVIDAHYDAVVISHYHADHAGLIAYKHDCPVYMGVGARNISDAVKSYFGERLQNNIVTYRNRRAFDVGGIRITPYLCDHSAFDSYMLLFEAGGTKILYTGDFRFHGRKPSGMLLANLPKRVDVLIHEGTNIGKMNRSIAEYELEARMADIMISSDKPVFVMQSASNIDRLVTVYRASKCGGRILYEDNFTALLASAAGGRIPRPDIFSDVFAFTTRRICGKRFDMFREFDNRVGIKKISECGNKFTMTVRPSMLAYLKKLGEKIDLSGSKLIYSLWAGYKEEPYYAQALTEIKNMGMEIVDMHTSGHAGTDDIELLKRTVIADNYVCVHTERREIDIKPPNS